MPDARIEQANRFLGQTVEWRPLLCQGDANHLLWGRCREQSLVLRLNADSSWAFGVSRSMEAEVLQAIREFPWSPQILKNALEDGWCLMRHHGMSLDQYDNAGQQAVPGRITAQLLQIVADMQTLTSLPTYDYPAQFDYYRKAFSSPGLEPLQPEVERLEAVWNRLPKQPSCLVHHDLHQGNFCFDHGQLIILDWEYAGLGNPWLDMAALSRFHQVPQEKLRQLPIAKNYSDPEVSRYLGFAAEVNRLFEKLWYAARSQGQ